MMHIHLIDCDSTQDVLKEQLRTAPHSETVLVSCENQLKGRGRGDHVWKTLPGTLCFSIGIDAHPTPSFTAIEISLLIARFFEQKGRKLLLKWPNDLFNSEEKKCGGILVQTSSEIMMTGIGLNLFAENPEFGGIYETAFPVEKKSWCLDLTEFILAHRYTDTETLVVDWEARCLHMNETIEIHEAGEKTVGVFTGLGSHGEAVLQTANGSVGLYNGSLKRVSSTYR